MLLALVHDWTKPAGNGHSRFAFEALLRDSILNAGYSGRCAIEDAGGKLNRRMNRYAAVVASTVLALIAMGAYVTSRATAPQMNAHGLFDAKVHSGAAAIVGALALYLALRQSETLASLLAWTFLALFGIQGSLGWLGERVLHATLAPAVFAGAVAVALVTSAGWYKAQETIDQHAVSFLRPLAMAGPPLVLLQTLLGASYRHKLIGVIPHLAGAMAVALASLIGAMLVFHRCPKQPSLRSAAKWLMAAVLAQVTLGIVAFAMQLLGLASAAALVVATTSHVIVGSLTMSASVVFAIEVLRVVRAPTRASDSPGKIASGEAAGLVPPAGP